MNHSPEPWTTTLKEHDGTMNFYDDIMDATGLPILGIQNENREDGSCIDINQKDAHRIVACVNALAGLNPAGVPAIINAVETIVGVLNAAKLQNGGEDSTNILSTLEGALRACKPLTTTAT